MILIDGKSQMGKSTVADYIASRYDSEYRLVYTVEDYLNYLTELRDKWQKGLYNECQYRWVFWDEPQMEIPRTQFWSERNSIIQSITSSFGFLKPSLVMALPNIKGLSDMVMTNVLFRMTIQAKLDKDKNIIRKAWIKTCYFDERRNKFGWRLVEEHTIPRLQDIMQDKNYADQKIYNFFNTQLNKWREKLHIKEHI